MDLVFASSNPNKVMEISQLIGPPISIKGLSDIGCAEEIPETAATIEGNAIQKAWYVYTHYHMNCFSDDTGLEIDALDGRPGVLSARYAGNEKNAEENIRKVLIELQGATNRSARFKTVIALVIDGKVNCFEGIVEGVILTAHRGTGGFGYDPVFQPIGFSESFAEMSLETKNLISHRALATKKLINFLDQLTNPLQHK
jgi:XTP/dITP diphosphohydrolase